MGEIRCRPIDQWHGPRTNPGDRRPPQYDVRWARTVHELTRELDLLDATDPTLGLDVRLGEIRLDGWPKANARPPAPVSLTFGSKYGPKRFECDRFHDWQQNARAICLTLQRLRLVDEGGCTASGEQYVGFGALPPGEPTALGAAMTLDGAARLLSEHSLETVEHLLAAPEIVNRAYRWAAKSHHPDTGGDAEVFRSLTAAKDLLLKAHDA